MESAAKVTTTIMLPPALRERLDDAAADLDRSRSWLAGRAIEQFLARLSPEQNPPGVLQPLADHAGAPACGTRVSATGSLADEPVALFRSPSADGHTALEPEPPPPGRFVSLPCAPHSAGPAAGLCEFSAHGLAAAFSSDNGTILKDQPMADDLVKHERRLLQREMESGDAWMRSQMDRAAPSSPGSPSTISNRGMATVERIQRDALERQIAVKARGNKA